MNRVSRAAATAATSAALTGAAFLTTATAAHAADGCGTGQAKVGVNGQQQCGKVTNYPDETRRPYTPSGSVTPAVGVDFRDSSGNRTGSGLSPFDTFEYLGEKRPGINGDGTLIKVRQTTSGKGGWGSLYEGWIPANLTSSPSSY